MSTFRFPGTARLLPLLFLLTTALPVHAGQSDGRLDIIWVDVKGGAATLIVTPAGESVLVDTGYPGDRDARRIHKAATEAGVKHIDHLVTTHYHLDHFGGAATLATLMPIRNVYDNGLFKEGWEKPSKEYLEFKCERRVVLNPGDEIALKQRPSARGREPDRAGPGRTEGSESRAVGAQEKDPGLRQDRGDAPGSLPRARGAAHHPKFESAASPRGSSSSTRSRTRNPTTTAPS